MPESASFVFRFGLTFLSCALVISSVASAQVFDTVINLPTDGEIDDEESVGDGTQLNVFEGGTVGNDFTAFSGSEVNITGGSVGRSFTASSGSVVNISGGSVGADFDVFGDGNVTLSGGEFRLNGADFGGTTIALDDGDVFTGTLADGSAFIFSDEAGDRFSAVNLVNVLSLIHI